MTSCKDMFTSRNVLLTSRNKDLTKCKDIFTPRNGLWHHVMIIWHSVSIVLCYKAAMAFHNSVFLKFNVASEFFVTLNEFYYMCILKFRYILIVLIKPDFLTYMYICAQCIVFCGKLATLHYYVNNKLR